MISFFCSSNFVSVLCTVGLTQDEAMVVNNCTKDLASLGTVNLQTEFMMFFISWVHQGRIIAFNKIIENWEDLWAKWCEQAKLFGIDPLEPHKHHVRLIEKLYARFPVTYDPSGL